MKQNGKLHKIWNWNEGFNAVISGSCSCSQTRALIQPKTHILSTSQIFGVSIYLYLSCFCITTVVPREVQATCSTLFKIDYKPRYCWTHGKTTHAKSNKSHLQPLQAWHTTEMPFLCCTDVVNIREEEKCRLPYCWPLFTFSSLGKFRHIITNFCQFAVTPC